jgi:RNA polymerase sigma factor (sigma-70 family)
VREHELRLIATDPDAFEAFYRAHIDRVQRFVARRVSDPYLAADLTTEVFLAALDSAQSYRSSRGTPTGWLYGVAYHVLATERRRAARDLRASGRIAGRRLLESDDLVRIEERLDAEAGARQLYTAMERLSPGERAVLELTALDGLSVSDAARALGLTAVAARVRLHRARAVMRAQLERPEPRDAPPPDDRNGVVSAPITTEVTR